MSTRNHHAAMPQHGHEQHPGERAALHHATEARPARMPAGGWLRETAARENWRTTTIVRRHRDQVLLPHAP